MKSRPASRQIHKAGRESRSVAHSQVLRVMTPAMLIQSMFTRVAILDQVGFGMLLLSIFEVGEPSIG